MNQGNQRYKKRNRNDKARQKYYKPGRYNKKQNYHKKQYEQEFVYQRMDKEPDTQILKQDLVQIGFEVAGKKEESKMMEIFKELPNCFNKSKRRVMGKNRRNTQIENLEEIKSDFKNLIKNEQIPDWYVKEEDENFDFDFEKTVNMTNEFQSEKGGQQENTGNQKIFQIQGFPQEQSVKSDFSDIQDMNFEQLDAYLEKKAHKNKKQNVQESESVSSQENSHNYFDKLEKNMQNMMEKSSKDDFEDDSDDSFQDDLGFNYQMDKNLNPKVMPIVQQKIKDEEKSLKSPQKVEKSNKEKKVEKRNKEKQEEKSNKEQQKQQKSKKTEEPKIEDQEIIERKKKFLKRYSYMDPILCQFAMECLSPNKIEFYSNFSAVKFSKDSVNKYCKNEYKIFSMYAQGNILTQYWLIKDKEDKITGPFISFDMDVWNVTEGHFTNDHKIAFYQSKFIDYRKYLIRDPEVIEAIDDQQFKLQEYAREQRMQQKKRRQNRKNFRKNKKQKEIEDFNKNFPSLGGQKQKQQESKPIEEVMKKKKSKRNQQLENEIKQKLNLNFEQQKTQKKQQKYVKKQKSSENKELTQNLKDILGIQFNILY